MCSVDAYENMHSMCSDYVISGGDRPLPGDSTI